MEHSHGGHGAPAAVFNATEYDRTHAPDPLSYIAHDFWPEHGHSAWPSLMVLHVAALGIAFFILLPVSISLRSVKHRWHLPTLVAFNAFASLGVFSATLYRKTTPNLYEGSKHGSLGWVVIAVVVGLSIAEAIGAIQRLALYLIKTPVSQWALAPVLAAIRDADATDSHASQAEYIGLVQHDDDAHEETLEAHPGNPVSRPHTRHVRLDSLSPTEVDDLEAGATEHWVRGHSLPYSPTVNHSDLTLHEPSGPHLRKRSLGFSSKSSLLLTVGNVLFHTLEHALVPLAFAASVTGMTVYTGICRGAHINGCMAHLIKGGIFWCYGLLSFARYLGAWRALGWAWNRRSSRAPAWTPSAEMVECTVIFVYGATNTWMERFAAKPGDPFTTKQVQHISIAVMFWFAGLVGMGVESRTLRRWLAPASASSMLPSGNPLPGLVIGVTGLAMAAHQQAYVFLVQIHVLWGGLLAAFAALRWMTYFLLFARAKTRETDLDDEPGRPPTELLASFFLSCGGLVFALSVEPIGLYAMRNGRDDVMMFLCLSVAVTCLAFTWMLGIMAVNGYLKTQQAAAAAARRSAPRRSQSL
ncbi:hypothetical protein AURDEDRAFT_110689 [Auricularia subglabra TFB-10046 SS5]|nr:hypothetical protein AURDEDRAFT_110689 [Auricularia subglabra TFB-10046 SS5]